MASRTPEEILAQREAWLARKAAREAGEDVPIMPPLRPGEQPPEPETSKASPELEPVAQSVVQTEEPAPSSAIAPKVEPKKPSKKRTPEEILAQREAFLARKAAREAGGAKASTPAKPKTAAISAAKKGVAAKSQPARKPAAKPKPKSEPIDPNISRRELINYAWLASLALFSVESVGLSLWFAFPNFKAGQFGGMFPIGQASEVLPEVNSGPVPYTDGKFWLVNVDRVFDDEPRQGVLAIYKVCTHLGCLYEWIPMTGRFECPCHGSKFTLTGDYLAGPARRSLDRFVVQALNPDGTVKTQTDVDGNPVLVDGEDELVVDTGSRIMGSSDITPA